DRLVAPHVTDAKGTQVAAQRPGKRALDGARIETIGPVNGSENQGAILDGAGDGADFIHAPREGHAAVAADPAERRSHTGRATARARRDDTSQRFATQREAHEPGSSRGCGTGRRAA